MVDRHFTLDFSLIPRKLYDRNLNLKADRLCSPMQSIHIAGERDDSEPVSSTLTPVSRWTSLWANNAPVSSRICDCKIDIQLCIIINGRKTVSRFRAGEQSLVNHHAMLVGNFFGWALMWCVGTYIFFVATLSDCSAIIKQKTKL